MDSDQEFNPQTDYFVTATLSMTKINDKPINVPQQKGIGFFLQVDNNPDDSNFKIIRLKTNKEKDHIEIIFNYEKFMEALIYAQAKYHKKFPERKLYWFSLDKTN